MIATAPVNSFLSCHCIIAGSWLFPGSTLVGRRNMLLEDEAHHVERAVRMIRSQDPTRGSLVASGEDACVRPASADLVGR